VAVLFLSIVLPFLESGNLMHQDFILHMMNDIATDTNNTRVYYLWAGKKCPFDLEITTA
jgi:hypothetical protein